MTFNYKSIIKYSLAVALVAQVACTSNYEDLNTPGTDVTDDQIIADDYKLRGAMLGMQGWVVPVQEHQFQFVNVLASSTLCGYLAEAKGWTSKISTYNPTDDWTQAGFNEIIPGISIAYNQLVAVTDDEIPLSVARVIRAAAIHQVTDLYGPIPYSKVGQDASLTAPYDSQEEVYKSLITDLTESIAILTERRTDAMNAAADMVYQGDLVKWVKFANTLKLRLALRLSYVDAAYAQSMAAEAVANEVGLLESNADNAQFMHSKQNLYYLLCQEWGDYRAAADIVSYMKGYNDPRSAAYFQPATFADGNTDFVGLRRGISGSQSAQGGDFSRIVIERTDPMLWMNAAEAKFLQAEAALRGWISGSAKEFYEQGVALSFDQWGASGADSYLADAVSTPAAYEDPELGHSAPAASIVTVAYNEADDFETNLERIITQKWIANFRATAVESWSEFRRTGYPKLYTAPENLSIVIAQDGFARRLPYPVDEYQKNTTNYQAAVSNLLRGADNMATRLWWDCNPNF